MTSRRTCLASCTPIQSALACLFRPSLLLEPALLRLRIHHLILEFLAGWRVDSALLRWALLLWCLLGCTRRGTTPWHRDDAVGVACLVGTAVTDQADSRQLRQSLQQNVVLAQHVFVTSYGPSSSVHCHLERVPEDAGLKVALPRAAPDVVVTLHEHDRRDGLCRPFLHTPGCAQSSYDSLKRTTERETRKTRESVAFRPDLWSDTPSEKPAPTQPRPHCHLPSARRPGVFP